MPSSEGIEMETKHPMQQLSLFSGYGGFDLGLRLAGIQTRTVGYVEVEPYCQELLRARIRDGLLDWAPIITDVRAADFRPMAGLVDIVTAGFPCQPHSTAGQRLGKGDDRNLWPDTVQVLREVEPSYVLLENVKGLADGTNPYAAEVVGGLSEAGYDATWHLLSAAEAGAPHLRERWLCLATNSNGDGVRLLEQLQNYRRDDGTAGPVDDAQRHGLADRQESASPRPRA